MPESWPSLNYDSWKDTYATVHMWTQVVGKVALALAQPVNHSWQIAMRVTARGLATYSLPYRGRALTCEFDFFDHELAIRVSDGTSATVRLEPKTVADFYAETMAALRALGIDVTVWPMPVEIPNPIRFTEDTQHASYDPEAAHRCWRALSLVESVLLDARCSFVGKCSPVHFFWGAFDLAVTRFSGQRAPDREGPDWMREAYSHEVISHGFWPGNDAVPEPIFYAYAAPEPAGFPTEAVEPKEATYRFDLGEFVLPFEAVRTAADPAQTLRAFVDSTYVAGATLGGWDRAALERTG